MRALAARLRAELALEGELGLTEERREALLAAAKPIFPREGSCQFKRQISTIGNFDRRLRKCLKYGWHSCLRFCS